MLLGADAAQSKANFMNWVDQVITSVCPESCKVYTFSGVRDHGNFKNLSSEEFTKVLAKLSGLEQWAMELYTGNLSCGAFIMLTGGGRGRISQQGMRLGPFRT